MDWIDSKTIYVILHIFGVALGAGGAFMSDVIFIFSTNDKTLSEDEFSLLKKAGRVVWVGLTLLIISGIFLVSTNPEVYSQSSKFITKMIIVGIIFLNGIIFHTVHLKTLKQVVGQNLAKSDLFIKQSQFLYYSGAVSVVSWVSTLVLGSIRSIPISVTVALSIYLVFIGIGIIGAEFKRRQFFKA